MISVGLKKIFFALKDVATFEIFLLHVIDRVEFLFSEAKGLGHHTAADIRDGIEVDLNTE